MGVALTVGAIVSVSSAFVVVVGWANARTQPRASDSPYRLPPGSPMAYILLAVLAGVFASLVLGLVAAAFTQSVGA